MQTLHPSCVHILCWSLKRSVKQTWTSSTFSTNESASSVMVTGSQSRVWSGTNLGMLLQKYQWAHGFIRGKIHLCIIIYHGFLIMNLLSLLSSFKIKMLNTRPDNLGKVASNSSNLHHPRETNPQDLEVQNLWLVVAQPLRGRIGMIVMMRCHF